MSWFAKNRLFISPVCQLKNRSIQNSFNKPFHFHFGKLKGNFCERIGDHCKSRAWGDLRALPTSSARYFTGKKIEKGCVLRKKTAKNALIYNLTDLNYINSLLMNIVCWFWKRIIALTRTTNLLGKLLSFTLMSELFKLPPHATSLSSEGQVKVFTSLSPHRSFVSQIPSAWGISVLLSR